MSLGSAVDQAAASMAENSRGNTPWISVEKSRELRRRKLEEKQKCFQRKRRTRELQLRLDNQVDDIALETESLRYQEDDLLHCQRHYTLAQKKLAENATVVADMEQRLNAEREKLAELQRAFDARNQRLQSEERQVCAEKEAISSLDRDTALNQQMLVAKREMLALTQKRLEECDDLQSVPSSCSENGSSRRPQTPNLSSYEAESLQENVAGLPRTPSSSHIWPIQSGGSERTASDSHAFTRDGHGYFLGSPKGELHCALLTEIRAQRPDQKDNPVNSLLSEDEVNVRSAGVVQDHRHAILEKAKKLNKPVEDVNWPHVGQGRVGTDVEQTDRIKYKASQVPTDPRTAIPDKMKKSARLKSFNELSLVRQIGQYVGEVNWFGEERPLAALLAYMTGQIKEPCTNCKKAADPGNQCWSK